MPAGSGLPTVAAGTRSRVIPSSSGHYEASTALGVPKVLSEQDGYIIPGNPVFTSIFKCFWSIFKLYPDSETANLCCNERERSWMTVGDAWAAYDHSRHLFRVFAVAETLIRVATRPTIPGISNHSTVHSNKAAEEIYPSAGGFSNISMIPRRQTFVAMSGNAPG